MKGTLLIGATVFILCAASLVVAEQPAVQFSQNVLPILSRHCFRCHEGRDADSGIRLDQRTVLLGMRGDAGPLVIAGDSARSRLWIAVSGMDPDLVMPAEGPRLSQIEVDTVRRWIDEGMEWDASRLPEDDEGQHWAFQPISRPVIPSLSDNLWSANPIDRFIRRRQREQQVQPAPQASRRDLIRRLNLTLLGVPPAADDVDRFSADHRPGAWSTLVNRVLASPHYGERWGRHWLDVARWAESEGYESNHPRAAAWRYRDYVVQSFNHDRLFDEFVEQQIAGDELPNHTKDNLIATGFLAAARISSNEEDKWLQRNNVNVDIVNAVGNAFLGLTIQCAQCHDHKFDPLPTRDYYRLQAFFVRGQPVPVQLQGSDPAVDNAVQAILARRHEILSGKEAELKAERLAKFSEPERQAYATPLSQRTPEQERLARIVDVQIQFTNRAIERAINSAEREEYDRLGKELQQYEDRINRAFVWYSPVTASRSLTLLEPLGFYPLPFDRDLFEQTQAYVMPRGDVHNIGERVQPGWPDALTTQANDDRPRRAASESETQQHQRLDLANWLTDRSNPLVARVLVNRIWQWQFGRGLVQTVNDFGVRGARPTHPELLDWLAVELIESGWSVKHIQRLILTSQTWRQSSVVDEHAIAADPDNLFYTRWTSRRLESEIIRDSMLAVSGELDSVIGGPSVGVEDRETSQRRSLYLFQQRGHPPEMQGLFDGPDECAASLGDREVSTSPLQSLFLLNSEFGMHRAEALAKRTAVQSSPNAEELVNAAWTRILQRHPDGDERKWSLQLMERVTTNSEQAAPDHAFVLLCQVLMNLNEFVYVE